MLISLICRLFARFLAILGRKNRLFYIGGAESLPRPLSPDEEAELLEMLPHSPDARSQLIERNLRLVVFIAKKFENTGVGIEDLISIGTIGLIKSVNTFRPDRQIKLATYASRCIENEILMHLRKISGQKELSIDEPLHIDWDGNELLLSDVLSDDEDSVSRSIEMEEDHRTITVALSHLSPREREIIELRFGLRGGRELTQKEDHRTITVALSHLSPREREIIELRFGLRGGRELTQKEVAARLGISQSYISRLEKKIIARLRVEIEGKV